MVDEWDVETGIDLQRDPMVREASFCLCVRDPMDPQSQPGKISSRPESLHHSLQDITKSVNQQNTGSSLKRGRDQCLRKLQP